jgi:tRNA(Arg) A34 adenosine deaminase TadA
MTHEEYMRKAVEKTRSGIENGQTPFGAIVVAGDRIVSQEHNTVWRDTDPTAHAEVNAIRAAAKNLGTIDLAGTVMYTTCEPCPMCLSAIHWSKIERVYFGATISDADDAGFSELHVAAADLARMGGSPLAIEGDLLRQECRDLFAFWKEAGRGETY